MDLTPYPRLTQAAALLLFDPLGAGPEAEVIRTRLCAHALPNSIVLAAVEGELATLSDDEFLALCLDDEARKPLVSSETEYLLELLYNWL